MSATTKIVGAVLVTCAPLMGFSASPARAVPEIPAQPRVAQDVRLPMSAPLNKTTVSGKYCSKTKSGNWVIKIPKSKKKGTELCRFSFKTNYLNVEVNSTFKVYKYNNARLKTHYSLTTYKQNVVGSWIFYASAAFVKQTGYSQHDFDGTPPSTMTYSSVKGVAFSAAGAYDFCQAFDYPDGPKLDDCWTRGWKIKVTKVVSVA